MKEKVTEVSATNVKQNKAEAPNKTKNKNKKPNKFLGFFKGLGKKLKEMWSELKKVTWPSFGKVLKQTGVVLVVCLIFLVVLTGIDVGLEKLLELVTSIGK